MRNSDPASNFFLQDMTSLAANRELKPNMEENKLVTKLKFAYLNQNRGGLKCYNNQGFVDVPI